MTKMNDLYIHSKQCWVVWS